MKTVIIGGVAGGATAAARLRRLDENAEIIIFEKGGYVSFANCGIPYYIGEVIPHREELLLQTPESFKARFNVDVRVLSEVVLINRTEKTVLVNDLSSGKTYTESYDKLILAPGAFPVRPPIKGIDSDRVFTVRNISDTDIIKAHISKNAPKSAAIIGGGYIGIEMAENLKRLGLEVSIIELSNQVISSIDYDMACEVHRHLEKNGITLYLENGVKEISDTEDGLALTLDKGSVNTDMVILSAGVKPDTALAEKAGLELDSSGGIITDSHMQTSDENIYAAGDAVVVKNFVTGQNSLIPLAGPANKQGRIAADNICGIKSEYHGTQGSSIIKVFGMTVAATGINEKTAKTLKLDYDKSFTFSPPHAGYYPGGVNMSIKTIFEKNTGKILGAQIVGFDGVDKRCDIFATAIRAGMTAYDLTELELCYAPPFSSAKDPVNIAGYVIENLLLGKVKNFHWHDVDSLPRDGSVTLLDVRTKREYAGGHIEGFINIPLDSLRDRIDVLEAGKPVYVHCHSGLRSYIAARILSQRGFEVYNLSGGYRLYKIIKGI